MYLKYKREEITWIDQKYLSKDIAKDVASFWVDINNRKLYCARETEVGIAHYYFDSNNLKWTFDYFCENTENFVEDEGMIFNLKELKTTIVDNVLYVIDNDIFRMKLSIEDTKLHCRNCLEMDINNICFDYLPLYTKTKNPLIAYKGNFKFIVFEEEFIENYILFSQSL